MKSTAKNQAAAPAEVKEKIEFKKVPGQTDYLPEDWQDLEYVLSTLESLARGFGFVRVEPALFEAPEIVQAFHKGEGQPVKVGNAGFRTSALPGLLRMYIEGKVPEKEKVSKWFYMSPVVKEENNPYQLVSGIEYGFQVFGDENAIFDAQILALASKLYKTLAGDSVVLEIGSRGCELCFPEYRETLSRSLTDAKYSLCKDCAFSVDKNPEKVLVCEEPSCQSIAADAPTFIDHMDQNCQAHLTMVLESLDELGVPYILLPTALGDEHTKRTVFNFKFTHPQDSFSLGRGSRHDGMFKHLNHPPLPALGMSGDLTKLLRAWRLSGGIASKKRQADVVLIPLGDRASKKSLPLFSEFWDNGISIINLLGENSLKFRLQQAADMKITVALVIGQKEALDDTVILRDVKSGMQEVFPSERAISEVKKRLGD